MRLLCAVVLAGALMGGWQRIVGATDDECLRRELVQRLYDASNEPKELAWIEGGHVDPSRPEALRPVLEIVWGRLRAEPQ